jgi:hypothetical protein
VELDQDHIQWQTLLVGSSARLSVKFILYLFEKLIVADRLFSQWEGLLWFPAHYITLLCLQLWQKVFEEV